MRDPHQTLYMPAGVRWPDMHWHKSSFGRRSGDFGPSTAATARIRNGEMVESDPTESSDHELAVGLTLLIQQPIANVLEGFRSALDMRADRQLVDAVALHGAPDDFARLVRQPNGAAESQRYLAARPGDTLNLSLDEIQAFHAPASSLVFLEATVIDRVAGGAEVPSRVLCCVLLRRRSAAARRARRMTTPSRPSIRETRRAATQRRAAAGGALSRVVHPSGVRSRLDLSAGHHTPFVGRQSGLGCLRMPGNGWSRGWDRRCSCRPQRASRSHGYAMRF